MTALALAQQLKSRFGDLLSEPAEFRGEIQRNGKFYKRLRFQIPEQYRKPPEAIMKLVLLLTPDQVVWEQ